MTVRIADGDEGLAVVVLPPTILNFFVDLSGITTGAAAIRRLIDDWSRQDNLGGTARRLTGTLPSGIRSKDLLPLPANWSLSDSAAPSSALNGALDVAGRDGVPLLLLIGPVEISNEAVGVLRRCLERDPMYGFALPRTGCKERCCFASACWREISVWRITVCARTVGTMRGCFDRSRRMPLDFASDSTRANSGAGSRPYSPTRGVLPASMSYWRLGCGRDRSGGCWGSICR